MRKRSLGGAIRPHVARPDDVAGKAILAPPSRLGSVSCGSSTMVGRIEEIAVPRCAPRASLPLSAIGRATDAAAPKVSIHRAASGDTLRDARCSPPVPNACGHRTIRPIRPSRNRLRERSVSPAENHTGCKASSLCVQELSEYRCGCEKTVIDTPTMSCRFSARDLVPLFTDHSIRCGRRSTTMATAS